MIWQHTNTETVWCSAIKPQDKLNTHHSLWAWHLPAWTTCKRNTPGEADWYLNIKLNKSVQASYALRVLRTVGSARELTIRSRSSIWWRRENAVCWALLPRARGTLICIEMNCVCALLRYCVFRQGDGGLCVDLHGSAVMGWLNLTTRSQASGGAVYPPVLTHSVCFLSIPSAAAVISHPQHDLLGKHRGFNVTVNQHDLRKAA